MALNRNSGALEKFEIILLLLKFIYSEKATKFCKTFTLLLTGTTLDKSKVEISPNFVAFSEYIYEVYFPKGVLKLTDLYVVPVKSKVKVSQNFVAFSKHMNFKRLFGGIF